VPTIVQLELSKWLVRELGEERTDQVIALRAADLHREHKLATADAIVYATAQCWGAELLPCDVHVKGLPGMGLLAKGA
jgi:hypothetical protein